MKYENEILQISNTITSQSNCNFKIIKINLNLNISFYYINHVNTNLNLLYSQKNNINVHMGDREELAKWTFIEIGNNIYKIQNKNNCFIKISKKNITCENINLDSASEFNFIKIYEEVNENKSNNEIIEKEPIDVLIKYIDLRDPNLIRTGIDRKSVV